MKTNDEMCIVIAAALRDALRRYMIRDFCAGTPQTECLQCRGHWARGAAESHTPGCLAALDEKELGNDAR